MASQPPPSPDQLTVHLTAADGATFDLLVPAPAVRRRAVVRIATAVAVSVQAALVWDGTGWISAR